MVDCELDFSGESYETTDFMNDKDKLSSNIAVTEALLKKIGVSERSKVRDSACVWRNVPVETILSDFLENQKYHIFDCSSLSSHIPNFINWLKQMNADGHYLKWNVAIAGDNKAPGKWFVEEASVGKITRTKKPPHSEGYIDIGSLRSGRDILCDVQTETLTHDQYVLFTSAMQSGKNLISVRSAVGLNDVPLLLLYRIDKDQGKDTKTRQRINSCEDVIGFSIIVPGESVGKSHVKSVQVRIPAQ
jgi:hypothetical protein